MANFLHDLQLTHDALHQRWRADGYHADHTLAEAIRIGAAEHPSSNLLFVTSGVQRSVTLPQLLEQGERLASGLINLGIRPGDKVAIQAPASIESTIALQALWLLGAVAVPIVPNSGPNELSFVLRDSQARAFFLPQQWRGVGYLEQLHALTDIPNLEHVVTLDPPAPVGHHTLYDLLDYQQPLRQSVYSNPNSLCCLLYTSGTSGNPKGVQHTHNTLLSGRLPNKTSRPNPARNLVTFPSGHIASILTLLRPLLHGGYTVIMDWWSPSAATELIQDHQLTATSGTPFFLKTLLDEADSSERDISSLRYFPVGAAPVSRNLMERAEAAGILAWRTYGSTEHPAITSCTPDDPLHKRHTTDGRATQGNEVRLVDQDGSDVRPGTEGEIVSRGPTQFIGYLNPHLNQQAFLPGAWFRTGDVGRFDEDGYLSVVGRKKDIIIRGGENISSAEVEDLLNTHPSVLEAAVCPAPDPAFGERVCAFIVLRPQEHLTLTSIAEHFLAMNVPRHKIPQHLEILEELPRTAAGKVKKAELQSRFTRS